MGCGSSTPLPAWAEVPGCMPGGHLASIYSLTGVTRGLSDPIEATRTQSEQAFGDWVSDMEHFIKTEGTSRVTTALWAGVDNPIARPSVALRLLSLLTRPDLSAAICQKGSPVLKGLAATVATPSKPLEVRLAAADVLLATVKHAPAPAKKLLLNSVANRKSSRLWCAPEFLAEAAGSSLSPLELRIACVMLAGALCQGDEGAALTLAKAGVFKSAVALLGAVNAVLAPIANAGASDSPQPPSAAAETPHHVAQRAVLATLARCMLAGPAAADALARAAPFTVLADAIHTTLCGPARMQFAPWPGAPNVALTSTALLEGLARRPHTDKHAMVAAGVPRALLALLAVGGPAGLAEQAGLAQAAAVSAMEVLLEADEALTSGGRHDKPAPFGEPPLSPPRGSRGHNDATTTGPIAAANKTGKTVVGSTRRVVMPPLIGSNGGIAAAAVAAASATGSPTTKAPVVWSALLSEAAQEGLACLSFVTLLARATAAGGDSYHGMQRLVGSHHLPFSAALAPPGQPLLPGATGPTGAGGTGTDGLTSVESRLVSILLSTQPYMEPARRRAAPLLWLLAVERARHTAARWARVRRLHRLLIAYQVAEAAEYLLEVKAKTGVSFSLMESYATKAARKFAESGGSSVAPLPAEITAAEKQLGVYDWRGSEEWAVSVDVLGLPTYVHLPTGRAQYLEPTRPMRLSANAAAIVMANSRPLNAGSADAGFDSDDEDAPWATTADELSQDPLEGLTKDEALAQASKVVLVAATAPKVLKALLGVTLAPAPKEDDREGLGVFLALWSGGYYRHSPDVQSAINEGTEVPSKTTVAASIGPAIDPWSDPGAAWYKDDPVVRLCTAAIAAEAFTHNDGGLADYRHPLLASLGAGVTSTGARSSDDDANDAYGDGEGEEEGEEGTEEGDLVLDENTPAAKAGSNPASETKLLAEAEAAVPPALAAGIRELQAGAGPDAIIGATTVAPKRGRHWPSITLDWDAPWVRDALATIRDCVDSLEASRAGTWRAPSGSALAEGGKDTADVSAAAAVEAAITAGGRLPFRWSPDYIASVSRLARSSFPEIVALAAFAVRDATTPVYDGEGAEDGHLALLPKALGSGVKDAAYLTPAFTCLRVELPLPLPSGIGTNSHPIMKLLTPARQSYEATGVHSTLWQFGWVHNLEAPSARAALMACGAGVGLKACARRLAIAYPKTKRARAAAAAAAAAEAAALAAATPKKGSSANAALTLSSSKKPTHKTGGWQGAYRGGLVDVEADWMAGHDVIKVALAVTRPTAEDLAALLASNSAANGMPYGNAPSSGEGVTSSSDVYVTSVEDVTGSRGAAASSSLKPHVSFQEAVTPAPMQVVTSAAAPAVAFRGTSGSVSSESAGEDAAAAVMTSAPKAAADAVTSPEVVADAVESFASLRARVLAKQASSVNMTLSPEPAAAAAPAPAPVAPASPAPSTPSGRGLFGRRK